MKKSQVDNMTISFSQKLRNFLNRTISLVILIIIAPALLILSLLPTISTKSIEGIKTTRKKQNLESKTKIILYGIIYIGSILFFIFSLIGVDLITLVCVTLIVVVVFLIGGYFKDRSIVAFLYNLKTPYRIVLLFTIFFSICIAFILLINLIFFA